MKRHGFTLMELMLTVVVIAILVSIAVPSYIKTLERAKAREAVATLESMRAAELAYSAERRNFIDLGNNDAQWNAIGLENPNTNNKRAWNYSFTAGNGTAVRRDGPYTNATIIMDITGVETGTWNP